MPTYKFDHTQRTIEAALGISKERLNEIVDFVTKKWDEASKPSEVIEVILNSDFNEVEKALALFMLGRLYELNKNLLTVLGAAMSASKGE